MAEQLPPITVTPPQARATRPPADLGTVQQRELAEITVRGKSFKHWETVWVQHRWAESYALFRFTAAEDDPMPPYWQDLQFKPGDPVTIKLGGVIAMVGYITDRQTAYDANNHAVMLIGKGSTWWATRSSVDHPTGDFSGKNFEKIAREVLKPYNVGIEVVGKLDPQPYKIMHVQKGETTWDFLERIARGRGIVLGSDHLGNVLLIGEHTKPISGDLVEGWNILKCQCMISIENFFSKYCVPAQTVGDDQQNMTKSSEQEACAKGRSPLYSNRIIPATHPVYDETEVQKMANNEVKWHEGTLIQANITTQGWFRPRVDDLWRAGDNVRVHSPMAILYDVLKIKTVTFTQDRQSGTLTTLELVAPWLLNDKGYAADSTSNLNKPPGDATTSAPGTTPAPTPDPGGNAPKTENDPGPPLDITPKL